MILALDTASNRAKFKLKTFSYFATISMSSTTVEKSASSSDNRVLYFYKSETTCTKLDNIMSDTVKNPI